MEGKHESDMTPKEKRIQELQKIKSLKGKQKLDYLWTYYRSVLFALLVCVFIICLMIPIIQNSLKNPILTLAIVDANPKADAEPLETELLNYMGSTGKHDEIVFDTTATSSGAPMKLVALLLAEGTTDVVICNSDIYESCLQKDCFLDWKDILGDAYSKYEMYMTDGIIDLSKIPTWQENNFTSYEPAYLGILQTSDHLDAALQFLEYLTH